MAEYWDGIEDFLRDLPPPPKRHSRDSIQYQLAEQVVDLRQKRGWTQAELAEAAGMTQSTVARFESATTTPSIPTLVRLAAALDAELTVRLGT